MKLVKKSIFSFLILLFFLFVLVACKKDNLRPKGRFDIIQVEEYSNACIFNFKYIPDNGYILKDTDTLRITYLNSNKDTENTILEKTGKNLFRVVCFNTLNQIDSTDDKEEGTKFAIKADFTENNNVVTDYEVYTFSHKVKGYKAYNTPVVEINSVIQYLKLAEANLQNFNQIDYKNYKLTADLDFENKEFRMLALYFGGSFDGNGFAFKNILQANFRPNIYTEKEISKNTTCTIFGEIKGSAVVTHLNVFNVTLSNNLGFGNDRLAGYGLVTNSIKEGAKVSNIFLQNIKGRLYTNGLPFLNENNEISSYGLVAGKSNSYTQDITIENCDLTYVNLSQPRSGFALAIGNQNNFSIDRVIVKNSKLTLVNKESHAIINEEFKNKTNTYETDPLITNYVTPRPETYPNSTTKPEDDKAVINSINYDNCVGFVCGIASEAKVSNAILISNTLNTSLEDEYFVDNKDENKVYVNLTGIGVGFTVKPKGDDTTGQNIDYVVCDNFRFVEKGTQVTVYFQEKFFAKDFNPYSSGYNEDNQKLHKVLFNGYTRNLTDLEKDKKNILKLSFIANENTNIQTLYHSFFLSTLGHTLSNYAQNDKIENLTPNSAFYCELYRGRILNYHNHNIYPIKPRYVICEKYYEYTYNDGSQQGSGPGEFRKNYFYTLCPVDENGYFDTIYEGTITNFFIFKPIIKKTAVGFVSGDSQIIVHNAYLRNNNYNHLPDNYLADRANNLIYGTDEFIINVSVVGFADNIKNVVTNNNKLAINNESLTNIFYNNDEQSKICEFDTNTNEFKGVYLSFTPISSPDFSDEENLKVFIRANLIGGSDNDQLMRYFISGIK